MRIENTKNISTSSIKMIIFGPPGVGKTSLAATTGEPTLIVSAESGLLSLDGTDIDVIDITKDDSGKTIQKEKRIARLGEVYNYLLSEEAQKKYKWIFIDSMTEIFQNLVEQLQEEFKERKDALVLWGEYAKRAKGLIKSFRDLPNFNVVFTALVHEEKDANSARLFKVGINGKIAQEMPAYVDFCFYYSMVTDADGNQLRRLLTGQQENVACKDRSGKCDKFEEPNLAAILKKVRGPKNGKMEKNKESSKLQSK